MNPIEEHSRQRFGGDDRKRGLEPPHRGGSPPAHPGPALSRQEREEQETDEGRKPWGREEEDEEQPHPEEGGKPYRHRDRERDPGRDGSPRPPRPGEGAATVEREGDRPATDERQRDRAPADERERDRVPPADPERRHQEELIDEAGDESFPASDPPAFAGHPSEAPPIPSPSLEEEEEEAARPDGPFRDAAPPP